MLNKKEKLIIKIIIGIMAIISIALVVYYVLDLYAITPNELNYYNQHFAFLVCLSLIGVIAILLPMISQQKFSEGKGDSMMIVVGFLLILCGIIAVVWSYISI